MGATLLIFANKQDLPGVLTPEQISKHLNLDDITTHNCNVLGSSAYTGKNIIAGLEWVMSDVSSRLFSME